MVLRGARKGSGAVGGSQFSNKSCGTISVFKLVVHDTVVGLQSFTKKMNLNPFAPHIKKMTDTILHMIFGTLKDYEFGTPALGRVSGA